jgi:hypothetical protein
MMARARLIHRGTPLGFPGPLRRGKRLANP